MHDVIRRLRENRADEGFTLIELLVVVVIIGVLVAIAVPVYLNYREGAANKAAQSDVRGAIAAVEQYYTDNSNTYPATQVGTEDNSLVWGSTTATASDGTTLSYENNGTSYVICGRNSGGNKTYFYNSSDGGSVDDGAYATVAACIAGES